MGAARSSVVALVVAGAAAVAPAARADSGFVWVKTSRAIVRGAPSGDAPVLASLPFAHRLLATGTTGDWTEVAMDHGRSGYIWRGLLTAAHPDKVWVTAATARLLAEPLPGARRVGDAAKGMALQCLGVGDGWDEVVPPGGGTAWVEAARVADAPSDTLFVTAPRAMVHVEASADSDVAAELPPGTAVRELGASRDFDHVGFGDGQDGWVFEGELGRHPPYRVYVRADSSSVYAQRTVDSTVVARVAAHQELSAFDADDGFTLVRTADGTVGWIYRDDVIPIGGPPTP